MVAIVAGGLLVSSLWGHSSHVLGATSDYGIGTLLNQTNTARAADHESALALNQQLQSAAQAKANDMVAKNYWAHVSPSGQTPWDFVTAAGYHYGVAGENLAYGFSNAAQTITGWMNSPEHRANILDTSYRDVGFGVASSPSYQGHGPAVIVVAEYAAPQTAGSSLSFTVPSPTNVGTAANLSSANTELSSRLVSRVQILSGGHAVWSVGLFSFILGGAIVLFIVRHGLKLHKVVVKGERFVNNHPLLDVAIVLVGTLAFVLTRSSGVIR